MRRSPISRVVVVCLLLVLFVLTLHKECEGLAEAKRTVPASSADASGWRRTRHGWEPLYEWYPGRSPLRATAATRLHPLVVGALVALLSMGALLMFEEPTAELDGSGEDARG